MIYREPVPLKNLALYALLLFGGLIAGYILFIGLISIWVGLSRSHQDGFWMPILVGALFILAVTSFFVRMVKFLRNHLKEKDALEI